MNIAICDDEPAQAKLLARHVLQWTLERRFTADIRQYHSADAFLFAWEDSGFDVLLLDIQMPGMDGMELARHIRERDSQVAIVFVTNYADYISEGYDVAALHYLMKPVSDHKLFAILDRAVHSAAPQAPLVLDCTEGPARVLPADIQYVEAFAHSCRITTVQGAYDVRQSLSDLAKLLEKYHFVQPHRSYLVNLAHVCRAGRDALEMDNGDRVLISRRRFDAVQRAFLAFYRGES